MEISTIVAQVTYPGMSFVVSAAEKGQPYLQISCSDVCNVSGDPLHWTGRKWRLSKHMTRSEIVQTAFLAIKTAIEHEMRERFKYRGRAIYGPHFNVEDLVLLCDNGRLDARTDPENLAVIDAIVKDMISKGDEADKLVREKLDWRGPNGSKQGHIVLKRADAARLIGYDDTGA